MSEMVERGAKALCERFTKVETWDRLDERGRNLWREMFRVAIAAAREPTASMLESGNDSIDWTGDASKVWPAMIDAALK